MNFKEYLRSQDVPMKLIKENMKISENLKFHLDNSISLCDNIFRIYSEAYFSLINEVKELYNLDAIELNDDDADLVETDLGQTGFFEGQRVLLDAPIQLNEADYHGKEVSLNKPTRTPGEAKKFAVYVKSGDTIKRVRFGDPKLSIKNNDKARSKSFRARHKCSEKKDKTTAGYWSCNIARYAKSIGLSSSSPW